MSQQMKMTTLNTAWVRLEAVCRKLWDENSTTAVEAQAVVEEYKGEVHRVDTYLANAAEMHALELSEHENDLAAMRRHYELEIAGLKKRLDLQEAAMRDKDARIEEVMKTLARKEEENLNFHSQILRMSASSDEMKTKKMEEFYQELMKTEATQADSWQKRHVTLEQENENRLKILTVRQTELDAWENRRLGEEESLQKRTTDVEIKAQQLAQEYRKKQQEIEDLKASLQRSITDLVRQYQARLHGSEAAPAPQPR
jgi:DNA repair exonuclease SbcCD ATPase subunit